MSIETSLTRRQALLLSGSAATLAAVGLSRWAQGAPTAAQALPIPRLIEARNSEPVTLALQKTQHNFGGGRNGARAGDFIKLPGPGCARSQRRNDFVPGGKPPR